MLARCWTILTVLTVLMSAVRSLQIVSVSSSVVTHCSMHSAQPC